MSCELRVIGRYKHEASSRPSTGKDDAVCFRNVSGQMGPSGRRSLCCKWLLDAALRLPGQLLPSFLAQREYVLAIYTEECVTHLLLSSAPRKKVG